MILAKNEYVYIYVSLTQISLPNNNFRIHVKYILCLFCCCIAEHTSREYLERAKREQERARKNN